MYTLGRWLLEDTHTSSEDPVLEPQKKREKALSLLQQAGGLGHAESYIYLASQYQRGSRLPKSDDMANRYFAKAADLRNPKAVISYARYIAGSSERESQTRLMPLLRELADADDPEAMVVIGNLYAKGVRSDARRARLYAGIRKLSSRCSPVITETPPSLMRWLGPSRLRIKKACKNLIMPKPSWMR